MRLLTQYHNKMLYVSKLGTAIFLASVLLTQNVYGQGEEEEEDRDNDGVPDIVDICPNDENKSVSAHIDPLLNRCGCGVIEANVIDTDRDGRLDCADECRFDATKTEKGVCGCGKSDLDDDNDGVKNCDDKCPNDPLKNHPLKCGCGFVDRDICSKDLSGYTPKKVSINYNQATRKLDIFLERFEYDLNDPITYQIEVLVTKKGKKGKKKSKPKAKTYTLVNNFLLTLERAKPGTYKIKYKILSGVAIEEDFEESKFSKTTSFAIQRARR